MADLYELTGEPAPSSPVLVVALEGWVDAGLAARTSRMPSSTTRS